MLFVSVVLVQKAERLEKLRECSVAKPSVSHNVTNPFGCGISKFCVSLIVVAASACMRELGWKNRRSWRGCAFVVELYGVPEAWKYRMAPSF